MFDSVIGLNFKGPFRLAVLAAERMVKGDGGSIINVTSTGSEHADPMAAPYCVAKAALNNMTEALARGYGPRAG
jgi:NAD(P)-dependent dehydrogenase (short-subunit alcohol dehydrogenase family)